MADLSAKDFLNVNQTEELLAEYLPRSLRERHLDLDLSAVRWISPLSLSCLFLWSKQVIQKNGTARIVLPAPGTYAHQFLAKINAAAALRREGIDVQGEQFVTEYARSALSAFETFESSESFERYRTHLDDDHQQSILLHSDTIPEVVSSGHVHRVLLKELVDNTFFHAGGLHSHYTLLQTTPAAQGRREHSLMASFQGAAYIEICVGDGSSRSLAGSLTDHVPPTYAPEITLQQGARPLDETEQAILYAFEYASTSNPERRRESLRKWLEDPELDDRAVATGLHDVASLVRGYGGQLIVRADGRLGTLDYSGGTPIPKASFWRRPHSKKTLAKLNGTVVCVRLPLGRYFRPTSRTSTRVATRSLVPSRTPDISVIGEGPHASGTSDFDRLITLEREILHQLQHQPAHPRIVAVVLDNLGVDAKLLSAFLELLTRIPRRGNGLALITSDPRHLSIATAAWERFELLSAQTALRERPAFAVISSPIQACSYGYPDDPSGTTADDSTVHFPSGNAFPLADLVRHARNSRLADALRGPEVLRSKSDVLFLLEKSFYTDTFFEIAELANSTVSRVTIENWVRQTFEEINAAAVISLGTPIDSILRHVVDTWRPSHKPQWFLLGDDNLLATAMKSARAAHHSDNATIALVTDVICTAERAARFLRTLPNPEKAVLVTLVDARPPDQEGQYLTVRGPEASKDVPIVSVLRHPVAPLRQKPGGISARNILVVDRRTFRPVRYAIPAESSLSADHVLNRAAAAGALAAGHFGLDDKHYAFFLALRPLFQELDSDIAAWLGEELAELRVARDASLESWEVLCVDEGTGLFALAERLLRDVPIRGPVLADLDMLDSPPLTPKESGASLWFIIPAMGSGRTIRRCLEYARQTSAKHVQVSVIVSRSYPDLLLFFQETAQYADSRVRIRNMVTVPLEAYNAGSCPVCALAHGLAAAKGRVSEARPRLVAALERAAEDFSLFPVESAAVLGVARPGDAEESLGEEAWLVSLYTRGTRDIDARRMLEDALKDGSVARRFAIGLGRVGYRPGSTLAQRLQVVYDVSAVANACEAWAKEPGTNEVAFSYALRGFAALVPNELRIALPTILASVSQHPELLTRLIAHAATETDLYWDLVDGSAAPLSLEQENLLDELRDFSRRGGAKSLSIGVFAIQELRRHFVRSLGWGTPLEILRISCRLPRLTWGEFRIHAARFLRDGYLEAERRVAIAKRAGILWTHLNRGRLSLDEAWSDLKGAIERFQLLITTNAPIDESVEPREAIQQQLDLLESLTKAFAARLTSLATRPGDAMRHAQEYSASSSRPRIPFKWRVADTCPALSIHESDLLEVILLLLENASDTTDAPFFDFMLGQEPSEVVMTLETTKPWRHSRDVEGGLVRIRELIAPYGALLELPLGQHDGVETGRTIQRIVFRRWED